MVRIKFDANNFVVSEVAAKLNFLPFVKTLKANYAKFLFLKLLSLKQKLKKINSCKVDLKQKFKLKF